MPVFVSCFRVMFYHKMMLNYDISVLSCHIYHDTKAAQNLENNDSTLFLKSRSDRI